MATTSSSRQARNQAAPGTGNTYPGIAVDIPSFSYQFSFEQSADWSRTYAKGRELKAYAERCVDKNGDVPLRPTSTPEAVWRSRRFPLEDYEFST